MQKRKKNIPLRVLYVDGVQSATFSGEMSVFAAFMWKIC